MADFVTHFTNPAVLAETLAALAVQRAALPPTYRNAEGPFGAPANAVAPCQPLVDAGPRSLIIRLAAHDDIETDRILGTQVLPALSYRKKGRDRPGAELAPPPGGIYRPSRTRPGLFCAEEFTDQSGLDPGGG